MTLGLSGYPVYGTCDKCGTEYSELFEYRPGYWICRANACWDEETEHDSMRHLELEESLDEYRRLVAGTQ